MKHILAGISSVVLLTVVTTGCSSTPDGVIPHDRMVDLLTDIHIGESVIEVNRRDYSNDSLRKVLKQSIFMKHGVTEAQFDSSLVWYGHHLDEYLEVYDDVIARLDAESKEADDGGMSNATMAMSVAGDSVDTWSSLRYQMFTNRSPMQYLSFAIKRDENMEVGDVYEWNFKLSMVQSSVSWVLAADYVDGTTEYTNGQARYGWNHLVLATDTAKNVMRVYGMARFNPQKGEENYVDSITLLRTRLDERHPVSRLGYKKLGNGAKTSR